MFNKLLFQLSQNRGGELRQIVKHWCIRESLKEERRQEMFKNKIQDDKGPQELVKKQKAQGSEASRRSTITLSPTVWNMMLIAMTRSHLEEVSHIFVSLLNSRERHTIHLREHNTKWTSPTERYVDVYRDKSKARFLNFSTTDFTRRTILSRLCCARCWAATQVSCY